MRHPFDTTLTIALLPGSMCLPPTLAVLIAPTGALHALPTRDLGTACSTVPLTPITGSTQLDEMAASRALEQTVTLHLRLDQADNSVVEDGLVPSWQATVAATCGRYRAGDEP
jgi:hypothetical protein